MLPITMLNFKEEFRRNQIMFGRKLCANLPTKFEINSDTHHESTGIHPRNGKTQQITTWFSLSHALNDSALCCLKSFSNMLGENNGLEPWVGSLFFLPFLLASYVADIPECVDMLLFNGGKRCFSLCQNFLISRDEINNDKNFAAKSRKRKHQTTIWYASWFGSWI